jgi:hypothetical protein
MDVRSHRRWSTTEKPWVAALLSKYAWRLVVDKPPLDFGICALLGV